MSAKIPPPVYGMNMAPPYTGFLILLCVAPMVIITSMIVVALISLMMGLSELNVLLAPGLLLGLGLWMATNYARKKKAIQARVQAIFASRPYHAQPLDESGFVSKIDQTAFYQYLLGQGSPEHVRIKGLDGGRLGDSRLANATTEPEGSPHQLFDVIVDQYSKKRQRKVFEIYSTVCEMKLAVACPHLVFDSQNNRNHQFKQVVDSSQEVSISAELDQYFKVYYPYHYDPKTSQLITPEIIKALLVLKDFDIEIVGDRLFSYGPLLEHHHLGSFYRACLHLQAQLNGTLSYGDHQPLEISHQRLRKNDFGSWMGNILVLMSCAAAIIISWGQTSGSHPSSTQNILMAGILGAGVTLFAMARKLYNNRRYKRK